MKTSFITSGSGLVMVIFSLTVTNRKCAEHRCKPIDDLKLSHNLIRFFDGWVAKKLCLYRKNSDKSMRLVRMFTVYVIFNLELYQNKNITIQ